MFKLYFLFLALLFVFPVSAKKKAVTTWPLNNAPVVTTDPLLYSLPKTKLKIDFIIKRVVFIKGPYSAYAQKYLGITDVKQKDSTGFSIVSVSVEIITEPDDLQYYLTENYSIVKEIMNSLQQTGKIFTPATGLHSIAVCSSMKQAPSLKINPFNNLSIYEFVHERTDTFYRNVLRDSVIVKVPNTKKTVGPKPIEMKAEEAAREILKARKRKQKLFSGQYDVYPQGDALKYAVIEFEDFEKDYLALFIGKEYTDSVQLTYYYSPDSQNGNSFNLFYLHPEKGIADTNLPGYKPVQVSINPINVGSNPETYFIKANNTFDSLETKKSPGFIFYRFPRQTEVSILNGTDRINNFTIDIYQYGAPVKIPVPFLKNWIMK